MYECANDTTIIARNIRLHSLCIVPGIERVFSLIIPSSQASIKREETPRTTARSSGSKKEGGFFMVGRRGGGGCGWKSNVKVTDVQAIRDQRLLQLSLNCRSMANRPALVGWSVGRSNCYYDKSRARTGGSTASERQSEFSLQYLSRRGSNDTLERENPIPNILSPSLFI